MIKTLKSQVQMSILVIGIAVVLLVSSLTFVWVTQTLNQNRLETAISYAIRYKNAFDYNLQSDVASADLIQSQMNRHFDRLKPDGSLANLKAWLPYFDEALTLNPIDNQGDTKLMVFTLNANGFTSPAGVMYSDADQDRHWDNGKLMAYTLSPEAKATYRELLTGGVDFAWSDGLCFTDTAHGSQVADGLWYYTRLIRYLGKPVALCLYYGSGASMPLRFEANSLDSDIQAAILDEAGHAIIRSDDYDPHYLSLKVPQSSQTVKDPATGISAVKSSLKGANHDLMQVSLINHWKLVYIYRQHTWLSTLSSMQLPLFALLTAFLGLMALLSRMVLNQLDTPLMQLSDRLSNKAANDVLSPIPLDAPPSSTEIQSLIHSYNQLASYLYLTANNLRQVHADLELKSLEKANELSKTNELLTASIDALAAQSEALEAINQQLAQNVNAINDKRKTLLDLEKMASLKYLVSGIAHELNTPIGNAITIATYVDHEATHLLRDLQNPSGLRKSQLTESVKTIRSSLSQLSSNLDQGANIVKLLESIAATDQASLQQKLDLPGFVEVVSLNLLQNAALKVDFNLKHHPDLRYVLADPKKLHELIGPLIDNSLTHGFEATMKHPMIQIGLYVTKGVLTLEYSDNGVGVPWEQRQHILTPFYSTDFGNHKGLGLSFVYNIVTHSLKGNFEFFDAPLGGLGIRCQLNDIHVLDADPDSERGAGP